MQSWSTRSTGRAPTATGASPWTADLPGFSGARESALARCGPDELAEARGRRDALLLSARALVRVLAHDPDRADCTDAGCALAGAPDGHRCGLLHRLARVEDGSADHHDVPRPSLDGDDDLGSATRAFEHALTEAVEAVRRCRQTEHGSGRCWFSSVPGADGCGEVLRAAHRLG